MIFSVIVCTYNRSDALRQCLNAIAAAVELSSVIDAEIIIVDNNSSDNTRATAQQWADNSKLSTTVLTEPVKGISAARNAGIMRSKGRLLLFVDDDCRVTPAFIQDAIENDSTDEDPLIRCGKVLLGDANDLPITIRTGEQKIRWSPRKNTASKTSLIDAVMGCNMSIRREIIEKIGLFDERFGSGARIPAGEDADFAFRAYAAGFDLEYVPNMVMHHFHGRKTMAQAKKLMRGYLIGAGAVYAKHIFRNPALCRAAYWDAKHAFRELVGNRNLFMPELGITYREMMRLFMVGALSFLASIWRRPHYRYNR